MPAPPPGARRPIHAPRPGRRDPPGHPSRSDNAVAVLAVIVVLAIGLVIVGPGPASAQSDPIRPEEGQVVRLYRSALGRHPDPDGYRYWVTSRIEGLPLAAVADSFLAGREFERRFGGGSDAIFVERVYRNVLGRLGDPDGAAYWGGQLGAGLSRPQLVLAFSESIELQRRTGTELAELPSYAPEVRPVSASDVAASWRPGCPVGPESLRAIEVDHVDDQGRHRRGVLIVHRDVTEPIVEVFAELYRARFPITSIRPIEEFVGSDGRADDDLSMAADNTSAFNCRAITGGRSWSRHAFGAAIDINPLTNPYVAGSTVLPPGGEAWVDRSGHHPGLIRRGDVVTRAFARAGWRWGGDFVTLKDYQHFSRNGR